VPSIRFGVTSSGKAHSLRRGAACFSTSPIRTPSLPLFTSLRELSLYYLHTPIQLNSLLPGLRNAQPASPRSHPRPYLPAAFSQSNFFARGQSMSSTITALLHPAATARMRAMTELADAVLREQFDVSIYLEP
jgi:hypothetical protein